MENAQERRLATIVSIDIAGFSRRSEEDEIAAAEAVRQWHDVISAAATAENGRIFNTAGDGFMLEFPTATAALAAARAMLSHRDLPPIRIGMHIGEIMPQADGDLLGHGVNVTARIQAMAPIGEAAVSDFFRRQVRSVGGVHFLSLGVVTLPKMEERVEVFRLTDEVTVAKAGQRKTLLTASIAAAAALGVVAVGVGVWDGVFRLHESAYRDSVRKWGVWTGIDKLSAGDAAQVPVSYHFVRRGRFAERPLKVEVQNGLGYCPSNTPLKSVLGNEFTFNCSRVRACGVRFSYDENGQVAEEVIFDQYGNPLETLQYVDGLPEFTIAEAARGCSREPSAVTLARFERFESGESAGFDKSIAFFDKGAPTDGPEGYHKISYTYDAEGRKLSERYWTPEGRYTLAKNGIGGTDWRYTDEGRNLAALTYVGIDGAPMVGEDGYGGLTYERDGLGRVTRLTYVDGTGAPTLNAEGIAAYTQTYDAHGNPETQVYFDDRGQEAPHKTGMSRVTSDHDDQGREVLRSFFGTDGAPVYSSSGIAAQAYAYEEKPSGELVTLYRALGKDGETIPQKGRTELVSETTFDEAGNIRRTRYLDTDGQPMENRSGVHDTVLEWHWVAGVPTQLKSRTYFDADGAPTPIEGDIVEKRYTYDPLGYETLEQAFGIGGVAARYSLGNHAFETVYDDKFRVNGYRYLDANLELLPGTSVIAQWTANLDDYGRRALYRNMNADGQPVLDRNGVASFKYERDRFGRTVKTIFLGRDGEPVLNTSGYAGWQRTFDRFGNTAQMIWLGTDGEPILRPSEASYGYRATYDRRQNRTSVTYLGPDLRPFVTENGYAGFRAAFDRLGNRIEQTYLDTDGAPILVNIDADGTEAVCDCGYSTIRSTFDDRGNELSRFYFGPDGAPALSGDAVAGQRREYDDDNNQTRLTYYGLDGEVSDARFGIATFEIDYDGFGRIIERRFFGTDGELTLSEGSGRSRVVVKRDLQGREIAEESYGPDGQLVNRLDEGWAIRLTSYGEDGKAVVTYQDKDGEQVPAR